MSDEREAASTRPSTASVLWAAWRQGLKDVQNAVLDPWNGVHQGHQEPGSIGNPTQAMVTQDIGTVHGYQKMLDDYAGRSEPSQEQERDMTR
ncbi:MAG: hypothetical protein KDA93_18210 [Planctomycetaceae bacterium]|nr:hypothetical protein [Planctomycetaceae bacterium]